MCATYSVPINEEELQKIVEEIRAEKKREKQQISFNFEAAEPVVAEKALTEYIVRPTGYAPVLTRDGYKKMRFGFKVDYSTSPLFNARSETAHSKRTFAKHFAESRCLVPAAYYMEKGKRFYLNSGGTMFFAGLYRKTAEGQLEYAILTRDSSDSEDASSIHDRMPVIIPERLHRAWLESAIGIDEAVRGVEIK